jgi:SnoaL-like domain
MEELIARDHLRRALLRYTRGVDRLDRELIDSCFFPDAIIEHGGMVFDGEHWGAAIIETMSSVATLTRHTISNHSIELAGATAYSEAYCDAQILERTPEGSGEQLLRRAVRYVDQFECRGGEWRSVFRMTVLDWELIEPIVDRPPALGYVRGLHSTDDVSSRRPLKPEDYDKPVTNGTWVLR